MHPVNADHRIGEEHAGRSGRPGKPPRQCRMPGDRLVGRVVRVRLRPRMCPTRLASSPASRARCWRIVRSCTRAPRQRLQVFARPRTTTSLVACSYRCEFFSAWSVLIAFSLSSESWRRAGFNALPANSAGTNDDHHRGGLVGGQALLAPGDELRLIWGIVRAPPARSPPAASRPTWDRPIRSAPHRAPSRDTAGTAPLRPRGSRCSRRPR